MCLKYPVAAAGATLVPYSQFEEVESDDRVVQKPGKS